MSSSILILISCVIEQTKIDLLDWEIYFIYPKKKKNLRACSSKQLMMTDKNWMSIAVIPETEESEM